MAADTYSAILGWLNQGTGNNNNSWGDNCDNSIFPIFERAIAGLAGHAVTGGTLDLSGSPPPAGPTSPLDMIQSFSGVLASNQIVTVPNLSKVWLVNNVCTGAFTLKFKTPSGSASVAIPQGGFCFVACDGGDGIAVGLSTSLRDVQWLGSDGTIALPGLSFASEATMGLRRKSSGVMALTIGGVDILTVSATGIDVATGLAVTVGGVAPIPPGSEMNTTAIRAPTGWYFEYGQTIARSTDAPLMAAITEGFTANTNGTVTLLNVSKDLRNLGLEGSALEGVGMATGTVIVSVDSASQITMSIAATNTATGGAVIAFPYGNGDASTTFTLPDARDTVAAGRGNMGGTAANRLTVAGSGVNSAKLNTIGGSQTTTLARSDLPNVSATVTITDSGHVHQGYGGQSTAGGGGRPAASQSTSNTAGPFDNITSNITGITAAFNFNGGVTQTFPIVVQPTRIRNVLIKR